LGGKSIAFATQFVCFCVSLSMLSQDKSNAFVVQ